jgi:hypothetical protein
MSALGHKQTFCDPTAMSALLQIATAKADIRWWISEVSARHSGAVCGAIKTPSRPTSSVNRRVRRRGFATSIQDTTASGGISGRLSITLSTKPKSLAISAVIK